MRIPRHHDAAGRLAPMGDPFSAVSLGRLLHFSREAVESRVQEALHAIETRLKAEQSAALESRPQRILNKSAGQILAADLAGIKTPYDEPRKPTRPDDSQAETPDPG